jgi:TonB-linked SusC/RagA family outer membrane protein
MAGILLAMNLALSKYIETNKNKWFMRAKLIIVLLTTAILQVSATVYSQNVTLRQSNAKLATVLDEMRRQTGFNFIYDDAILKTAKPVDINIKNADIEDALELCFKGQPFTYTLEEKTIVIKAKTPSFLERVVDRLAAIDVHGRVVDKEGKPLPGATVKVKGAGKSVSTNANGEFYLEKVEEGAELVVSFIGYVSKEVSAQKEMGSIVLELSDSKLDEVQVIAYGETTRRLSTGNISTVKAADIEKAPVSNPLLAIQGRIPGIVIEQSSGTPGAGVRVQIQGRNSLGYGSDPFYVVDGIPYSSQMLPGLGDQTGNSGDTRGGGYGVTGGNPLNFINPQDIESIDILKDADATSIYGSRAANGAIIITTKKGKAGKTQVNFNLQQGLCKISRKQELLNTEQYLAMRKEAYANDNREIPTSLELINSNNADVAFWDQHRYTDWQKVLIGGTAKYTNLMGSVTGGTTNTQFLATIGLQREGTVTPADLRDVKGSIHFSLNNLSENKKFRFVLSGTYVDDDNKLSSVTTLVDKALTLPPNAPTLYSADGTLNDELFPNGFPSWSNPMGAIETNTYINKTNNLLANAVIGYELTSGLELKSSFGYNRLETNEINAFPFGNISPQIKAIAVRRADFNTSKINSWILEPQLNYFRIIGRGKLDALIGATIQQEYRDRQRLNAVGFSSDAAVLNLKAAASVTVDPDRNAVILSRYRYNALFGRINYNFDDRYIVNLTARRDGSSRFGKENKFHNFGAMGVAWIISNESFVKEKIGFLSFSKLKLSYGITGSDQIGDYSYLNLYQNVQSNGSSYQDVIGLEPSGFFPNPYLQWEETKKFSAGLDLGFFKDRILINATYYQNHSFNQLSQRSFPQFLGGYQLKTNLEFDIQNQGVELLLNTTNINTKVFKWSSSFNFTVQRNKILDIDGTKLDKKYQKSLDNNYVYHFLGVDPTTGLYQVADKNGKPTSSPNPETDKTVYVDLNPKFNGGMINSFSYNGFTLDLLFQLVKQVARNNTIGNSIPGFVAGNQPVSVLSRWQNPGDFATIQRYGRDFSLIEPPFFIAQQSDYSLADASYVRLKNLSISYELLASWINKVNIRQARLFIQGQNLLTITNYAGVDPETKSFSGMPPLKVLTFGLQLGL